MIETKGMFCPNDCPPFDPINARLMGDVPVYPGLEDAKFVEPLIALAEAK